MAFSALLLVSACAERTLPLPAPSGGSPGSAMDVLCYTGTDASSSFPASKSLIWSTSAMTLDANFIRIDDSRPYDAGSAYPRLSEAGIVEASVYAPSDLTAEGQALRSTAFTPSQHYEIEIDGTDTAAPDTAFYKTRMVGWYPRTCVLPREENGQASSTAKFSDPDFADNFYSDESSTGITFLGKLDGQTDIMVSNMMEGMRISEAFRNKEPTAAPPFGHKESEYSNYFTFKHYLSAVRIYISCDNIDLSLLSWGEVRNVVFPDQPTTVTVRLPEKPDDFGEVVDGSWADPADMNIITTPIDGESGETVSFPVSMVDDINGGIDGEIYLGYILVRPDVATKFEIHTDAGIFGLEIPVSYTESDGTERTLLEAGKIYNINVEVNTDGELAVFIKNDDDKKFRDLSPWNVAQGRFETANCYLINPLDDVDYSGEPACSGYFFNAMQAGNGDKGLLNVANRDLYPDGTAELRPVSASILFQTRANTIRNVELIDGHVRFELNEQCYAKTNPLQANAVIAVHDAAGNILWSWLIWITQEAKDVKFNNGTREFSLLNMNLGANTAQPGNNPLATYGLYYQWGRKDPSPRPPTADFSMKSMETIEFYGPNGEPVNYVSEFSSDQNTIEDSARNPLLLMDQNIQGPDYSFDWLYYEIDQLWGESVKTVYDPCPYGYKVPADELETLFNYARSEYAGYNISTYGVSIGGGGLDGEIYFPFAGWKGYESGVPDKGHPWQSVGTVGDYHDARIRPDKHRTSNRISANNGVWNTSLEYSASSANRTSAAPVRCVRYAGEP